MIYIFESPDLGLGNGLIDDFKIFVAGLIAKILRFWSLYLS